MNKPSLVINSHSSNIECLSMFFKCMETYVGVDYFENIYLFINHSDFQAPNYVRTIYYDPEESFKKQMCHCLSFVNDDIILYCNEDYLFYDYANLAKANSLLQLFKTTSPLDFIKFVHTDIEKYNKYSDFLYIIDRSSRNNFSQTLSFWRTETFKKIHDLCPDSEIGEKGDHSMHLENVAKDVCRELGVSGLCYYEGEKKRGMAHFDTNVFPHIASAINRGKWTSEYPDELNKVLDLCK